MPEALRRIPLTTLCSGWNGTGTVTMACPDNTGLAQHEASVLATLTGGASQYTRVWMRPADCSYFVPAGVVTNSDALVFRGILDAIQLEGIVEPPVVGSVSVDAFLRSVATTFNSSAGEAFEEKSRRRYTRTQVCDGVNFLGAPCTTHQLLSQHQLSCGGGVGTIQFMGGTSSDGSLRPLGRSMNAAGDYQIVTGYFDTFAITKAPSTTTLPQADVISIAQELITGECDVPNGSPMNIGVGQLFVVPAGNQMMFFEPITIEADGELRVDGVLHDIN